MMTALLTCDVPRCGCILPSTCCHQRGGRQGPGAARGLWSRPPRERLLLVWRDFSMSPGGEDTNWKGGLWRVVLSAFCGRAGHPGAAGTWHRASRRRGEPSCPWWGAASPPSDALTRGSARCNAGGRAEAQVQGLTVGCRWPGALNVSDMTVTQTNM